MTNRAINKAIANFIGWKELDFHLDGKHILGNRPTFSNGKIISYTVDQYVPDYCNDLNAIHEAILSLPFGLRDNTFILILANVCGFKAHGVESWSQLHAGCFAVINATAAQRAEAFLKTIDKWKE